MLVRRVISTAVRIDSLPSEDRQCQKPMGGSSGGEQEPLWGVVVVTWHLGDQTAVGEDDYHENYCLSFILYMRLTGGVCVVVGSSLQSPRPVLHSSQSIGSH